MKKNYKKIINELYFLNAIKHNKKQILLIAFIRLINKGVIVINLTCFSFL